MHGDNYRFNFICNTTQPYNKCMFVGIVGKTKKNLSTILNKLIKVHCICMTAQISFNKQFWLPCISLATIWYKPHHICVAAHATNEQTSQISDIQFHWLVNIQLNIQLKFDWFRRSVRVCVCACALPLTRCNTQLMNFIHIQKW